MGKHLDTDLSRFDWWQSKAIKKWEEADRTGIVEAVTGSGKTHVAYKAIGRLRQEGPLYPLVVVPTIPLLAQWKRGLQERFPGIRVGLQGNGHHDTFGTPIGGGFPDVIVATIFSAVKALQGGLFAQVCGHGKTLLVADECHHVLSAGAKVYPKVLSFPMDYRLGLTATLDPFCIDGLGKVVYTYDLKRAVAEGVIPPFDILNIAITLTGSETEEYWKLRKEIGELMEKVRLLYDLSPNEDDGYWIEVHRLAEDDGCPIARHLLAKVFRRAEIVYTAQRKMQLTPLLIRRLVESGRKLIVFFERISSADDLPRQMAEEVRKQLDALAQGGAAAPTDTLIYHSGLSKPDREKVLETFRTAGPCALLACRALNEGLDVPLVDGAIIVASTQSRREMIQRIGRTLRQVPGKPRPLILVLHAKGTNDVFIATDDSYFNGPARIFCTDPAGCEATVNALLAGKPPAAPWELIWSRDACDTEQDLLPKLGELAGEGVAVKLELMSGMCKEGTVECVSKHGQVTLSCGAVWFSRIRKLWRPVEAHTPGATPTCQQAG